MSTESIVVSLVHALLLAWAYFLGRRMGIASTKRVPKRAPKEVTK